MSALKKPAVAAMIMVICIILALLIGRAGGIASDSSSDVSWAETVNEIVNKYSTVGTIQEAVKESKNEQALIEDGTIVVDEETQGKRTTVSTIIIVLGVILVIKGLSKK